MAKIGARIQRAIDELAGNEALLEMLDTDAAVEMLEWGKTLAASIVKQTEGMDDLAADLTLLPRLKAVRQTMRTVGNWAAGKYTDPASRVQLREKLLEYFRNIFGEKANLPAPDRIDALIQEVDDQENSPQQLILKLKDMLNQINTGDSNDVPTTHNEG
jgi:hypothetical protein